MALTCSKCSRLNPVDASYCYFDGTVLGSVSRNGGPVQFGSQAFHSPFVFPSGLVCRNFDQLALACQENWPVALEMLQDGYLESFLGSLGRVDLARAAREAARAPDRDRGLDQFLGKLPSGVVEAPRLRVEPTEINLGLLQLGDDRRFDLTLENQGMRLLYGSATCVDCVWLSLGDASGVGQKVFEFHSDFALPVHVRGKYLRAGNKPLEGRIVLDTNGGKAAVNVRVDVPVKPFAMGVLAGAVSPRQVAEKAKVSPKEAALLMENGAVARWYRENGWTYPVQGPAASGLGAVQQFFEALGLTTPPKVDISELTVRFHGQPGDTLQHELTLQAREKRPIFAHAASDRQWLEVGRPRLSGRSATIPLVIPSVPNQPGEMLQSRVMVMANGNQRFSVAVSLSIGDGMARGHVVGGWDVMAGKSARAVLSAAPTHETDVITAAPVTQAPPRVVLKAATAAPPPVRPQPAPPAVKPFRRVHLLPLLFLVIGLGTVIVRDILQPNEPENTISSVKPEVIDPDPYLTLGFHDKKMNVILSKTGSAKPSAGHRDDDVDNAVWLPSMRFGLRTTDRAGGDKKLTFMPDGETNNTCLRMDGDDYLFGDKPFRTTDGREVGPENPGHWETLEETLGADKLGRQRIGKKSVWVYDSEKISITQIVELVPGDDVFDGPHGEAVRHLDTCLVRYLIQNNDRVAHKVGLRFLLDTYIGSNDGVPFLIPAAGAAQQLCDTEREFNSPAHVPDYIQALEHESLDNPGTIARVQLKLGGGIEPPTRVTLGAWPNPELARVPRLRRRFPDLVQRCNQEKTMWDVPVLPIKSLPEPDSAVTIYWGERKLEPGEVRQVGFAYGLGSVSSSAGGQLGLTARGSVDPGAEFTLTALVRSPKPGQTVTLVLPEDAGFGLVDGKATQEVPPLSDAVQSQNSPVTWRIQAPGHDGTFTLRVDSSTGVSQTLKIRVKQSRLF